MTDAILVETTTDSKEHAHALAAALVDQRLAACVNYFPVSSVYRWQGAVEHEDEYLLLAKSTRERYPEIEAAIKKRHTYDCPAITCLPLSDGSAEYLAWITAETKPSRQR